MRLLTHQHFHEGSAVFVFFQLFEQGFLRLCHRTSDAMTFAFELAHVDARTGGFAHTVLRSTIQEGAKIAGVIAYACNLIDLVG